MQTRPITHEAAPDTMKAFATLERHVRNCGLKPSLIELVKARASQINSRTRGEKATRLFLLESWRESPLYTGRERAALAWTEALAQASQPHFPDTVYEEVRRQFSESEMVKLTLLIDAINAWNRLRANSRTGYPAAPAHAVV